MTLLYRRNQIEEIEKRKKKAHTKRGSLKNIHIFKKKQKILICWFTFSFLFSLYILEVEFQE